MPASCCCCCSCTQCLNLTTDDLLGWCCWSWTQRLNPKTDDLLGWCCWSWTQCLNSKTDDLPAWCCCSWTQCLNLKTDHPTWVVRSIKGFYPEEELWTRSLLHCLIQSLSKQASFLHSSLFPLIATFCPPRNHPSCSPRIQPEITKFAKSGFSSSRPPSSVVNRHVSKPEYSLDLLLLLLLLLLLGCRLLR